MLVLEKQEYDLNLLFSFDSLKQILIKLANSQNILEDEMKKMHQYIFKNDKLLVNLTKQEFKNDNIGENGINNLIADNKEEKEKLDDNNKSKELNISKKEDIIDNEINSIEYIKNNNINEDKKNIKENGYNEEFLLKQKENKDTNIYSNYLDKINNFEYTQKINNNLDISSVNNNLKDTFPEQNILSKKDNQNKITNKLTNELNNNNSSFLHKESQQPTPNFFDSKDLNNILNQLKEQKTRINSLENKLSSKELKIQNLENKIKSNILENESKMKSMNEKINSLLKINENLSEKIEKLEVKTSDLDILTMFKDGGDGNIDATKILVKSLEEKVFKKFELLDEKYKKDSSDNMKLRTNVENMTPQIEQIYREIERINEVEKQNNEDLNSFKKNIEEKIDDNVNNISDDLNNKMEEIKNEIEKSIKNKIANLEKNVNELINKSNDNSGLDFLKLGIGNSADGEKLEIITKKINDLRTKINNIENTLKLYINSKEIDLIKNEIKDTKLVLDKKITKDDLKELYNFHLNVMDEINDLKERESIMHDDLIKTVKDLQNIQQRVESINGNLSILQNNPKNENMQIIDFSKYIDNKKFSDTLKPIIKEIENVIKEIETLKKGFADSENKNSKSLKSAINLIEDDTNSKINEIQKLIQKKYLEKLEFHKTIKSLEIQLKSTEEEKKKLEADSWLLAKKPINCFNCASCEAKIKNDEYVPADYLAWKKYPRGEKIHRMGQGFSHMLQMMTSEFIKNIEKNEFPSEQEVSSRNINNANLSTSPSYHPTERPNINSVVLSNKEREDSIGFKKKTKFILPRMNESKNKIKLINADNLPISDDENNDIIISDTRAKETETNKEINAPKILKITKKGKANLIETGKNKGLFKNLVTVQGVFTPREKNNQFE